MGHSEAGRGPTQTPGAAATAAPTSSAGGGKAGRLAPVTPHALVSLLLRHLALQGGHLDTQPGLIGRTGVQLGGFKFEPGHPNDVILVPSPLGMRTVGRCWWGDWAVSPRGHACGDAAHVHKLTCSHLRAHSSTQAGPVDTRTHTQRHTHHSALTHPWLWPLPAS